MNLAEQTTTGLPIPNTVSKLPLGTVAEIFTGLALYRLGSKPGVTVSVINVKDVEYSNDPGRKLSQVSVPDPGRVERYRLKARDVLVTARGTSLKSGIVPERWSGAVLSSNLIAVRLGGGLRPELLLVFLQSPAGRQAIERRLAGSNLLVLTPKTLREIEVPVLPASEQDALADLVALAETQYAEALTVAQAHRQLAHRIALDVLRGKDSQSKIGDLS